MPMDWASINSLCISCWIDCCISGGTSGSASGSSPHARSAPRYTSRRRELAPRHLAAISRAYTSEPPNFLISINFCGS